MNPGKKFEKDFENSAKGQDVFIYRLRDCGGWNKPCPCSKENELRFTPSNDYDSFLYYRGTLLAAELKSHNSTSFPFNRMLDKNGNHSKQLKGLLNAFKYEGIISGVIINYRKYNRTFFIRVDIFLTEMESSSYKSLNVSRAEELGVEINQKLLRTRFKYDILSFLKSISYYEIADD